MSVNSEFSNGTEIHTNLPQPKMDGATSTDTGAAASAHSAHHAADRHQEGLLVIVVDTNPQQWFPNAKLLNAQGQGFQQLISSMLVFVNSYLLLHRNKRIVIIAAHAGRSEMLYPDPDQIDTSGSAEQSLKVNSRVMEKLQELGQATFDPSKSKATAIAASISRALCCEYDILSTKGISLLLLLMDRSLVFVVINRAINEQSDLHPRILVIQKSPDVSEHYISIMNGIFSAQKKSVAVDACIISREHSSFMQQAAYLTGGIYYKPNDPNALLQYLISIYLPEPSMRKLLKLPTQDSVDFRAMCFCHQRVISTAFVCPVCLSLFCEFRPICSTCGIRSRIQPTKKTPPKKRVKEST